MKGKGRTLGVILIAIAFIFTSCKKDVTTSNLTLDLTKKAKVKAYFFAELDKTKQGLELVPDGTKVFVSIPNSSFNPDASGEWRDTASIKNGFVEVTVPTISTGVTATITANEFTYDQVQSFGSVSSKVSKIFSISVAQTVDVYPFETKSKEITFDDINQLDNFTETVTCAFILKADMDETLPGDENVPQGTIVNLYNDTWAGTATVGAEGKITATIPKGEDFSMRFEATKTLTVPPSKKFRYSATVSGKDESSTYAEPVPFTSEQIEN